VRRQPAQFLSILTDSPKSISFGEACAVISSAPSCFAEWRPERAREGAEMEPTEIQARATIAAALILTHAVEVPTIPTSGDWSRDIAALRLRDLTDYVYQMITSPQPR
jgi:hypothetical protein